MTLNELPLLLSLHLVCLKGLEGSNHLFQGTVSAFTRRNRKITKYHSYEGHYSSNNLNWVPAYNSGALPLESLCLHFLIQIKVFWFVKLCTIH